MSVKQDLPHYYDNPKLDATHSILRVQQGGVGVVTVPAASQRITNANTDKIQDQKGEQNNSNNQIQQQKDKNPATTCKINKNNS